ncbi:hypothetical protein C823_000927 [Eubacterium plexicaudatum ASF492]|nr:hypothetical protein C823_000927 [Eubacterium plexicaudatum ASF492]
MKDRKKYLPCLLIAMLFVCMMQVYSANAAASPSLSASADAAGVSEGGYVNVSVNLSGNPSISTIGAALAYDSSVLRYESASWNSGFSGSDMKMASDTGSEVNLSVVCDSSYSADGTVVTVRFQAVSDSSSIPVTLSLRDMADADLAAVTDCKVSSRVHVPETAGSRDDDTDKKMTQRVQKRRKQEIQKIKTVQKEQAVLRSSRRRILPVQVLGLCRAFPTQLQPVRRRLQQTAGYSRHLYKKYSRHQHQAAGAQSRTRIIKQAQALAMTFSLSLLQLAASWH